MSERDDQIARGITKGLGRGEQWISDGKHRAKEDVPSGIQQHELQKHNPRENTDWHFDQGKPRLDLIPMKGFIEVGKVMEYGAKKYGEHNWSKYAGRWAWTQLIASALRHIVYWMMGEDNDKESGLNHLGHANANLLMLTDLQLLKKGVDDRNRVYTDISDAEPAGMEQINRRSFGKPAFEEHWSSTHDEPVMAETDQQFMPLPDEEPIPDEEIHDGFTFVPFHPLVRKYWDDQIVQAARYIEEGKKHDALL